ERERIGRVHPPELPPVDLHERSKARARRRREGHRIDDTDVRRILHEKGHYSGPMPYELKAEPSLDVPITMTTAALVVGSELGKADLAPDHCRWCGSNALDDGTRDLLRWDSPRTAATVSDASGFLVAPATSFVTLAAAAAHDGASHDTSKNVLIVLESVATSAALNQIVKFSVARERPYAFHGSSAKTTRDAHLSFFSGHTSLTTTLAAAG